MKLAFKNLLAGKTYAALLLLIGILHGTAAVAAPPTITLIGNALEYQDVNTPYTDLGATAVDENGLNITSLIVVDASRVYTNVFGVYTVYYTVTDAKGNTATATRNVSVVDRTPPVISTTPIGNVCLNDFSFSEPPVTATDNYYPAISITRSGNFDISRVGTYTVVYTATDGSGNISTYTRTITVVNCTNNTTGIAGVNNQIAKIYPNPCSQTLFITPNDNNAYNATLYGIDGKKITTQVIDKQNNTLQVNGLASGVYTLQLNSQNGNAPVRQKIIIE